MNAAPSGIIHEIFSSIQGEGVLVGRRQVFVRFCGCNLRCRYCDTPAARATRDHCLVQIAADDEEYLRVPNPLSVEQVVGFVCKLHRPDSVQPALSATGGEPLAQADFLAALLPRLQQLGIQSMLETNGTLPDELSKVLPYVNRIAMDIKLPSCAGEEPRFEENRRFIELGRDHSLFVKIVVCAGTTEPELEEGLRVVRSVDPGIVVVLQPVTAVTPGLEPPTALQILRLERCASQIVRNVRVIPQLHRLLKVR